MKRIILSAVITLIILITGLSFIDIEKNTVVKEENSIIYALDKIPTTIKNVSALTVREKDIICATSKGLVQKTEEGKIEPSLSSEINIRDNGIEYEFKIRDDVYWNDGRKITPSEVVDFFRELLKEESDSNIEALLNVYGAKEYRKGAVDFENGVAINSTENSVIIRLNKKDDKFLEELTKPEYRVRKFLVMWEDLNNNYSNIPYTGDFYISNIRDGNMELKSNEHNFKNSSISKIELVEDKNVELAMAAYEVGERDIVVDPPKSQLNRLASENKLITSPSNKGKYLWINNESEELPLSSRRTLYSNIYEALSEYSTSNSHFAEASEGSYFREDKDDLTKLQARKVMSNKDKGSLPDVVTMLAEDTIENRVILKSIQDWYKVNSSISFRYSLVSKEEFKSKELRKRYDMAIVDAEAGSKDREAYYTSIKEWFTKDQLKLSEKEKFSELEESLFSNYTLLPLIFENRNIAISGDIKNLKFDFYGNLDFSKLKNKE